MSIDMYIYRYIYIYIDGMQCKLRCSPATSLKEIRGVVTDYVESIKKSQRILEMKYENRNRKDWMS